MYLRALHGKEKALGPKHTSTLGTVHNLGTLYSDRGKLVKAEKMHVRALEGKQEALGPKHTSTLEIVNNLGDLYRKQGKLDKAEKMLNQAFEGQNQALGLKQTSTLEAIQYLGRLYFTQGKLVQAEKMYTQALQGYEDALYIEHVKNYNPALNTMMNIGDLYSNTGPEESKAMYRKALSGYTVIRGASSDVCLALKQRLNALEHPKQSNTESVSSTSSAQPSDAKKNRQEKGGRGFSRVMRRFKR